jgi:hypothetical protein
VKQVKQQQVKQVKQQQQQVKPRRRTHPSYSLGQTTSGSHV